MSHKDIGIALFVFGLLLLFIWAARAFVQARRHERAQAAPEPHTELELASEAAEELEVAEEPESEVAEAAEPAEPEPGKPAEAAEAAEPEEAEPAELAEPAEPEVAEAAEPAEPEPAVAMPKAKPKVEVARPAAKPKGKELKTGLRKTRRGFVARLGGLFRKKRQIDADLMDELEEILFTADIGVRTSEALFEEVKLALDKRSIKDADAVWTTIKQKAADILDVDAAPLAVRTHKPFVLLTVGVNGVGKTTTIGKLAQRWADEGLSVLLAAGDTFRAAAVEQLEVWAKRVGAPIVKGSEQQDPSSVIFDAIRQAVKQEIDVVICDTAGRLHTKTDLMQELEKIHRVSGKALEGAPHETLLVLDATTGQNAIQQANLFKDAVAVTGIVLTKLDGTAKGGIILGICDEMKIPVRYIGIGEGVEDLRQFKAEEFVEALFTPDEEA